MGPAKGHLLKAIWVFLLLCIVTSAGVVPAGGQEVWTVRGDFSWVVADDDFDPVDNLYGASFDLLHDVGAHLRIGGEVMWVAGDRGRAAVDQIFLLSIFEYSFQGDYVENYDVYLHIAFGGVYVDARDVSGVSDEDFDFAGRPAVGLDLFLSEHVALNLQAGYLFGEVTLDGGDFRSSGFEGKVGLTVIF